MYALTSSLLGVYHVLEQTQFEEQHEFRKHEKMEEHINMVTAKGFVAKTLLADWPPCANMISVLS